MGFPGLPSFGGGGSSGGFDLFGSLFGGSGTGGFNPMSMMGGSGTGGFNPMSMMGGSGGGGISEMVGDIAGTNVKLPPPRVYQDELRRTLAAQMGIYPELLSGEQGLQPQWSELTLNTLNDLLFGTGGAQGLLGQYTQALPGFSALNTEANRLGRGADVSDLLGLGTGLRGAFENATPERTALRGGLTREALLGLDLGSQLAPEDRLRVSRQVRGDWANRGLGTSNAAELAEALGVYGAGEDLRQRRMANASGVLQQVAGTEPDYMEWLTGTRSGAPSSLFSGTGSAYLMGQNLGPTLLQPESQYAADLYNQLYQAQAAANAGTAANNAQMISALFGVGGSVAGPLLCWAAREVFQDARWLQFRRWLLTRARPKLREWYRHNGERWAARLAANPAAKAVVKRWMERRLIPNGGV